MTLRLTTIATALMLAFALALMVNVYTAKPAQAHFICCHSVDGNGNIHWRDYQQYDGARSWAVGEWNGVGRISILSDNNNVRNDLNWLDYAGGNNGIAGYWRNYPEPDPDVINFNIYYMNRYSVYDREAVAVHELGHALKLAHANQSGNDGYWIDRSIMYTCPACTAFHRAQAHDRNDYHYIW